MNILGQLVVAIILAIVSYVLTPKPKGPEDPATQDLDVGTAEAGRPIPVVFGEGTIKSPNVLWYGQVETRNRKLRA